MCVGFKDLNSMMSTAVDCIHFRQHRPLKIDFMKNLNICFYHVHFNGASLIDVMRPNMPTCLNSIMKSTLLNTYMNLQTTGNTTRKLSTDACISSNLLQMKSFIHLEKSFKNCRTRSQCFLRCVLPGLTHKPSVDSGSKDFDNASFTAGTASATEVKELSSSHDENTETFNANEHKQENENTSLEYVRRSTAEMLDKTTCCTNTESCDITMIKTPEKEVVSQEFESAVVDNQRKSDKQQMELAVMSLNGKVISQSIVTQCSELVNRSSESSLPVMNTWKLLAARTDFQNPFSDTMYHLVHKDIVTSVSSLKESNLLRSINKLIRTYSLKQRRPFILKRCNLLLNEVNNLAIPPIGVAISEPKQCRERTKDDNEEIYHLLNVHDTDKNSSGRVGKVLPKRICIENLHVKSLFTMTETEVADIQRSVEYLVSYLLYKVGDLNSNFMVRDIVINGSFYDGTKIVLPDEFDFLAVIDRLSGNGIAVSRDCKHNHGFAHVKLDMNTYSEWDSLSSKGYLHSIKQGGDHSSFRDQFRIVLHEIVQKAIDNNSSSKIHNVTGLLRLSGYHVSLHGPECVLTARWYSRISLASFPISIDICPAIQADCVSDILEKDDPLFWSAYQSLLYEERFFLIPSDSRTCSYCFKLAFPDSDRCLVTSLSETNIKCFRVLKRIFSAVGKENCTIQKVMNSFAIKMAVLWHADSCTSGVVPNDCMISILQYIRDCLSLKVPFLPNIHIQSRNIWRNIDKAVLNDAVLIIDKLINKL